MDMDELVLARYIEAVRAEGQDTSWGYHSRASAAHRYVAMTVPKVACNRTAGASGNAVASQPFRLIIWLSAVVLPPTGER